MKLTRADSNESGYTKIAWHRNPVPPGQSAPGHLNCPCGNAPETYYKPGPDITCACGNVYTWDGWVVKVNQ